MLLFCRPFNRVGIFAVIADEFLHPYHVVPAAELIAAFAEMAYFPVTHVAVEKGTLLCEIFVLGFAVGYAGVEIKYSHVRKTAFKLCIEPSAATFPALIDIKIDAHFNAAVIGLSGLKASRIGIADDASVSFGNNIGILLYG